MSFRGRSLGFKSSFLFFGVCVALFSGGAAFAEWFKPVDADAYLRRHGSGGAPSGGESSRSGGVEGLAPKKVKLLDDTPIPPPDYEKFAKVQSGSAAKFKILNRITDEVAEFSVPSGQPTVRAEFKIAVSDCRVKTYPDHSRLTSADVFIDEVNVNPDKNDPVPESNKPLYEKTMYLETPGVNGFEHPEYDIWLIACENLENAKAADPASDEIEKAVTQSEEPEEKSETGVTVPPAAIDEEPAISTEEIDATEEPPFTEDELPSDMPPSEEIEIDSENSGMAPLETEIIEEPIE